MNDRYTPPSVDVTLGREIQALAKNYPDLVQSITSQMPAIAAAQYGVSHEFTPKYYQDIIYNEPYLKQMNEMDQRQREANQLAGIASDVKTLSGPGREAINQAMVAQRQADPEFFANRGILGDKMSEALNASSATLSPTERAEMERSIARSNPRNVDSALNTASNAMQFGQAGTAKANNLANVVAQVANALPQLRSGTDVYGIGTGRAGLTGGPANQRFDQNQAKADNTSASLATNLLNTSSQAELQRQQLKGAYNLTDLEKLNQGMGAGGAVIGGIIKGIAGGF